jgi:hypothetical protein
MLHVMRALLLTFLISSLGIANAQTCSTAARAAIARRVRDSQAKALAIEAAEMDSGVSPEAALRLIDLKKALAEGADFELGCAGPSETPTQLEGRLKSFLRIAAAGMRMPKEPEVYDPKAVDNSFKPVKGLYGNDVVAHVKEYIGPPHLLEVTIEDSVTCGSDSQLFIYQSKGGHWTRALRWSSDFAKGAGTEGAWTAQYGSAWGDFFLIGILIPSGGSPESWRAVVAHGTPWCQSRFSGFGLAVVEPGDVGEARIVWQTDREYSRLDFEPRLRSSGDTFEFRVNRDEMQFDEANSFERLAVYRYRVSGDTVTRIEPVAANARGFVEEWLTMPWKEALAQSNPEETSTLEAVYKAYHSSDSDKDTYTKWHSGPVYACAARDRFQVTMTTERERIVVGKPGGESTPGQTYYFQLQRDNGYRLLTITTTPDPTCTGPDLMKKAGVR